MNRRTKIAIAGVATAAVIAGGAAAAVAGGGDDAPLTGSARDRAIQAALEHVGQGTVTESETGDGGAAYAVEVRLPDGRQVEVALDERFQVIGSGSDDDGPNGTDDEDGGQDD
jgi:uncharacterized membrane protein YkoI